MNAIRTGCIVVFFKSYFKGGFRSPKFDGKSLIKAEVTKHSYGQEKGQHTFTLKILEIMDNGSDQTKKPGEFMLIKGRNLYPNLMKHEQGTESKNCGNEKRSFKKL